jgi:transcriptional regulator with XRE-family HTH domain
MVTSEAVKALRGAYGEAQQAFSNRLHMSVASIANYETGARSPDAISARKLYLAALDIDREDLAAVFAEIIAEALGDQSGFWDVAIRSESEFRKIRAVQYVFHDPRFAHLQQPLAKLLAPVEAYLQTVVEAFERVAPANIPGVAAQKIKQQQKYGGTDPWGVGKKARKRRKEKK